MSKNNVQEGKYLTLTAPTGGVLSGKPYLIGALVVVAMQDAAVGEKFEAATGEVWEFTKVTADAPSEGDVAYLVAGTTTIGTTSAGNNACGHFVEAQVNGDTVCKVRLSN